MGIEHFLSEENLRLHKEYLEALQLKKTITLSKKEKSFIQSEIRAHTLYFLSFRKEHIPCPRIKDGYGSENRFCFILSEYVKDMRSGFLYIYPMAHRPFVGYGTEEKHLNRALLAIDLWEHAYFLDYGFDFSSYLTAALSHLDFSRLK